MSIIPVHMPPPPSKTESLPPISFLFCSSMSPSVLFCRSLSDSIPVIPKVRCLSCPGGCGIKSMANHAKPKQKKTRFQTQPYGRSVVHSFIRSFVLSFISNLTHLSHPHLVAPGHDSDAHDPMCQRHRTTWFHGQYITCVSNCRS